jgi:two-component system nitrate/nitrite sensor histidine kinase NarX
VKKISRTFHNDNQKPGLRWVFLGIALLAILALVFLLWIWTDEVLVIYLAFLLAAFGLLYLIYNRYSFLQAEINRLELQRQSSEEASAMANQRLEAVFRLSQNIVDASDENEVIHQVLTISVDLVGALGASFVPLDERGQPIAAISHGNMPAPDLDAWFEYLASPAVRRQCSTCSQVGSLTDACPLLDAPLPGSGTGETSSAIYCLPLRRGEREYGLLNLYLPEGNRLDEQTQEFLRAMLDETAMALEGVRLRRREMATFRQLQDVRQRADLAGLLATFLENSCDILKADFAHLRVWESESNPQPLTLTAGDFPASAQTFVENLIAGQSNSPRPVLFGDVSGDPDSAPVIRSLLIVPLVPQEGVVLGTLVCGNVQPQSFTRRQLMVLQSLATQAALVVQNSQLLAALEYKAMMSERTRLAREIHDGLAQTLGLLKLLAAQMQNYADQEDWTRLEETLRSTSKILGEAYLDARQSIDGLRISTADTGLLGWLEQTVVEFSENSQLPVELEDVQEVKGLPPEIQAQLVRILQEALSNVRKHSGASQAWVTCISDRGDLVLEVRDDGNGFSPEDLQTTSRYGLRGMRERSELIGADFQVISCPNEGTTVRVRLPLPLESVTDG